MRIVNKQRWLLPNFLFKLTSDNQKFCIIYDNFWKLSVSVDFSPTFLINSPALGLRPLAFHKCIFENFKYFEPNFWKNSKKFGKIFKNIANFWLKNQKLLIILLFHLCLEIYCNFKRLKLQAAPWSHPLRPLICPLMMDLDSLPRRRKLPVGGYCNVDNWIIDWIANWTNT